MVNLTSLFSGLLALGSSSLIFANPTPNVLLPRVDCTGVAPSLGGQACGAGNVMTCIDLNTWQCPNGNTGTVPPGTECICNAFRHPGWVPNNALLNPDGTVCTKGIVCVVEGGTQFRVCGVSGLQPVQDVPPGTVCRNGGITWP
ncbi:uncharacterized protein PAC_02042 [Phialocephala subalpina]|uniref:Uncharacterized protein n=1 Tax=Phialocephala subalpina TaxID=576137 RepID=A0A1L7WHD2_9HELO|nr:uncharacterized protein PAC_02042 [Phialocephala subalpina]